jgi:spore coat polysaccharide biosynthesis protein SpsF (cytidylyltransferase family)
MGSSRLPGKVLMPVAGRPALDRLVERLRAVPQLDDIVLATTTAPADDALADWAAAYGLACHRGSEDDVLQRVVEAQRSVDGEIVVEVTGDCTLICPDVIALGIETFLANDCDVVSNWDGFRPFRSVPMSRSFRWRCSPTWPRASMIRPYVNMSRCISTNRPRIVCST